MLEFIANFIVVFGSLLVLFTLWFGVFYYAFDKHNPEGLALIMIAWVLTFPFLLLTYPFNLSSALLLARHDSLSDLGRDAPILLFLRSFPSDRDKTSDILGDIVGSVRASLAGRRDYFFDWSMVRVEDWNIENAVVNVFSSHRTVAIGKPTELFQKAGASRMYVTDEAWQSVAEELMRKADLVVMHLAHLEDARAGCGGSWPACSDWRC